MLVRPLWSLGAAVYLQADEARREGIARLGEIGGPLSILERE
jgi:hypothetical protein